MLQGLVQVARPGGSEETVASICLEEKQKSGDMEGEEVKDLRESKRHIKEEEEKVERERLVSILMKRGGPQNEMALVHQLSSHFTPPMRFCRAV